MAAEAAVSPNKESNNHIATRASRRFFGSGPDEIPRAKPPAIARSDLANELSHSAGWGVPPVIADLDFGPFRLHNVFGIG
jgi:hypothetical protein